MRAGLTSVGAGGDITTATGTVTFGAAGTGALVTAGNISTGGSNITFNRDVTLSGDVVVDSGAGGGNILFSGDLAATTPGADDLRLTAGIGSLLLDGSVGTLGASVGDLVVNSASSGVTMNGFVYANSVAISSGGAVTINNPMAATSGFRSEGTAFDNSGGAIATVNSPIVIAHTGSRSFRCAPCRRQHPLSGGIDDQRR